VLKHLAARGEATIVMASQVPEIVEEIGGKIAVLSGARIIAYDTMDGLRKQTGCVGALPEVFEKIVNPQTLEQIERYFNRPRS